MKLRSILALALGVLALGCTSSSSSDERTTVEAQVEAESKQGGIELVAIPVREPPRVEVQSPGDEPFRPLRLHPAAGTREELEMSVAIRMGMRNGAQELPSIPVPITKTTLSATVEEAGPEGMKVRQVVESVEAIPVEGTPPAMLEQVRKSVEPLAQYRAVVQMDPRGAV